MPDHDFRSPRLYFDADLARGTVLPATPTQTNYLSNVLRMKDDDPILVFNGRHGEWRCLLRRPAKKKLEIVVEEQMREQTPPYDLHYLFAPLKHARLDYTVQKAVEMGAGLLQPVVTQHVQASRVNLDRMHANAVEAAEQCGILSIPEIGEPIKLDDALDRWDPARCLIFCDEREPTANPIDELKALGKRPLGLLIGPEGGFSTPERQRLNTLPFVTSISLGPRILRADTAAVAALAVVQAVIGDWGNA